MTFDIPVFITARMGSTRLPGKHMLDVCGKPSLERMIERVKHAKLPVFYCLCTTTLPEDDVLVEVAEQCEINVIRGHETDILSRWLVAADTHHVKFFVSAEADDVFCDPVYIDRVIRILHAAKPDYVQCKGLPIGTAPTGINVETLRRICEKKTQTDTEGQAEYFVKNKKCTVLSIEVNDPLLIHKKARMTLDYFEDYEFICAVYSLTGNEYYTLQDIIELLHNHPELVKINRHKQKEYTKRYREKYVAR